MTQTMVVIKLSQAYAGLVNLPASLPPQAPGKVGGPRVLGPGAVSVARYRWAFAWRLRAEAHGTSLLLLPPISYGLFKKKSRLPSADSAY